MIRLQGKSTQGVPRVLHCEFDERRGYCLWVAEPDHLGNPKSGGHSIYISPEDVQDEAVRLALAALCR